MKYCVVTCVLNIVSQFTLYASFKGTKPDFHNGVFIDKKQ